MAGDSGIITLRLEVRILSTIQLGPLCLMIIYAIIVNGETYSIERLVVRPPPDDGGDELQEAA